MEELNLNANPEVEEWWKEIYAWRSRNCLKYQVSEDVIKPQQVIETVYKATRDSGVKTFITTDVGQHQMFAAQFFKFDEPRTFITSGGLGTMGFGFPAAAGVKVAHPDAQVICFTGDGSFQMNMQELSTCKQYHLPVKIFILDNHTLGMVRQWQSLFYHQRYSQTDLTFNLRASAAAQNIPLIEGNIHSSDVFYRQPSDAKPTYWEKLRDEKGCLAVEMESFALFHNAKVLGKRAACLLTISDSFVSPEITTAEQRQTSFTEMMKVALGVDAYLEK